MKIILIVFLIPYALFSQANSGRDTISKTVIIGTSILSLPPGFIPNNCPVVTYIGSDLGDRLLCRLPDEPDFPVVTVFNDGLGSVTVSWHGSPFSILIHAGKFQQFIFDGNTWSILSRLKNSE